MEKITLALALLLLAVGARAQGDCFNILYEEGKTACERRELNTALKRLTAARDCPDKPRDNDLETWIRRAEQGRTERSRWHKTLKSDDREAYQSYLSNYPNGYYRRKAEENLRRLEALAAQPLLQNTPAGNVNWTQEYAEAQGQSIINKEKWPNEAQAIAMAQRGAEVVAKANLLEIIGGVHITRSTTVRDMTTESDLVQSRVEGVVKGARLVGKPEVANGMVSVTLRAPMFGPGGVTAALLPAPAALPDTSDFPDSGALALVLRVPSSRSQPVLFPSFVDAQNNLLLDGAAYSRRHSEPLVRWCHAADFSPETRVVEAAWDEQGRLVLPASAVPLFQNWLKIREAGGGALPIVVAVP